MCMGIPHMYALFDVCTPETVAHFFILAKTQTLKLAIDGLKHVAVPVQQKSIFTLTSVELECWIIFVDQRLQPLISVFRDQRVLLVWMEKSTVYNFFYWPSG